MKLVIHSKKKNAIFPPTLCFLKDMTSLDEQMLPRSFVAVVVVSYVFVCFVAFVGTRALFCSCTVGWFRKRDVSVLGWRTEGSGGRKAKSTCMWQR